MKDQEIYEGNRIIAEFMEAPLYDPNDYDMYQVLEFIQDDPDEKHFFHPHEMKFHSDWNWFMAAYQFYLRKFSPDDLVENEEFLELRDAIVWNRIDTCFIYLVTLIKATK